ncbi:MAG: hypothetical protein MI919_17165, partial [Holophagales bacterium]|nr:hypothetical protein [Holophagales bacterium]
MNTADPNIGSGDPIDDIDSGVADAARRSASAAGRSEAAEDDDTGVEPVAKERDGQELADDEAAASDFGSDTETAESDEERTQDSTTADISSKLEQTIFTDYPTSELSALAHHRRDLEFEAHLILFSHP